MNSSKIKILDSSGNVILYLFAAMAMFGFLVFYMTKGVNQSAISTEAQEMSSLVKTDLLTIHNLVQECALSYQKPVDIDGDSDMDANDNPNPPFPLYNRSGTGYGGTGVAVKTIICPGKPDNGSGSDKLFNGGSGQFFSTLSKSNYTVTYFSDAATGIKVTVDNSKSSVAWTEAMSRLDMQLDQNNAGIVDIDTATGTCGTGGGCAIYWIKKN